ncbi:MULTISPECIES: TIGR03086 family metal-binding protein [Kitasatospora]|uniref:TIGR03086 family metal-binding protein n=1 Tax=Kitasatospora cathayae TaxID=3004092 RepID=A0ABY7Q9X8_9ACTN|nr:TIGR03086 family metal-binding protein [Kitasatospora sp. HUAS 3-15]WBP89004.1 TIGR03086 family metal-binding protein [Kitasatospora sp. HUAS 3-15]
MSTVQDARPQYRTALAQLERLFAAVNPADLDRPTPCDEYTLRQLLNHVVGGIHRFAFIGEGGRAADILPGIEDPSDDGWPAALARAAARATAAWADDAKLGRPTFAPWGEVPGAMAVGGYVMEAVVHSWDIAVALDGGFALDDELAHTALAVAELVLPPESRVDGVPFGAVLPAAEDADVHARLAAWMGRKA